ncbi:GNAT family N-acetyltransferase [Geodermatophilus dictyosporus]|uniref:GNAT family N-acetyltransferase n=1 Tax=Geodermatophilus dictyosporus TaxID=1523247 RepID=UPI003CC7A679
MSTRDGAVAGHVCVTREGDGCAVSRLFVAPDARGLDLGAALLGAATAWAAAEGLGLVLDVVDDAGPAIALYERLGWTAAGTRPAGWTTRAGHRPLLRVYRAPAGTRRGPPPSIGGGPRRVVVRLRSSCRGGSRWRPPRRGPWRRACGTAGARGS